MAKNPEDRYQGIQCFQQSIPLLMNLFQDCKGLLLELATVQKSIKTNTPLKGFVAGARDLLRQLRIPQKLYGREKEVETLTNNFRLICEKSPDASTLVIVHGNSGVCQYLSILIHQLMCYELRSERHYLCTRYINHCRSKMDIILAESLSNLWLLVPLLPSYR